MNKISVAFCEKDEVYRNRFVTYLMEHKSGEISVHAFWEEEAFLEKLKEQTFDAIVLGSGFAGLSEALLEKGHSILVFREREPLYVAEEETYESGAKPIVRSVFRYQEIENIIREIYVVARKNGERGERFDRETSGMEIIGVYSPDSHEMQMPFSLILAQSLAVKRKVLYLNLMTNSGFLGMFGLERDGDLGDIIIKLRGQRLLPETFQNYLYEMSGFFYVAPFRNPENLHEFSYEDFLAFIEFVGGQTDMETILLDFGAGLDRFSQMMDICDSIYCPGKPGFYYECRKNEFRRYLDRIPGGNLLERCRFFDLPFSAKRIRGGGEVLRQLGYSEFGDYIRMNLKV